MYQKLNTPLNWLFLFLTPVFVFLWSQNGWGLPSTYWLLPYTHPDIIDNVADGNVEGVFYSYQTPGRIFISPNGEWMLKAKFQPTFTNLLTGQEIQTSTEIKADSLSLAWLNNETVLIKNVNDNNYYFLDFQSSNLSEPIPYFTGTNENGYFTSDSILEFTSILENTKVAYALSKGDVLRPDNTFVFLDQNDQWYILKLDLKDDITELYKNLPDHVTFTGRLGQTNYSNNPGEIHSTEDFEHISPNKTLYAKVYNGRYRSLFGFGRERSLYGIGIFRADTNEQIASIEKRVFPLRPIGWSADNQTLYFQVVGSARMEPWPIFSFQVDESLLEN